MIAINVHASKEETSNARHGPHRRFASADDAVMSAFIKRLHARKNVPLDDIASHIAGSIPPARFHTVRLIENLGLDNELVAATIDLTTATPTLSILTAVVGPRVAKWHVIREPSPRPGVIDICVSVSDVDQRRREAVGAYDVAMLLAATSE